jgi:transposase
MPDEYWLGDKAWMAIEPLLPKVYAGARRHDDRRIISGIVHVLCSGCRWKDCPSVYGPHTTVHNRFNRWSGRGGSVSARASKYNRTRTSGSLCGRQDADHREEAGEDMQAAVAGGNMLVTI